jgi:C4-dicarboxylate-specific signal transduction histidine kinase
MPNEKAATILVIDDIADNINLLSDILKSTYRVKAAISGAQGLKVVQMDPPDLILLDIMMPDMDGYEVLRRLKGDPATENIPVIFISAKNEIGDQKMGFDMGAVDYITKPVSVPIVKARVATHIALHAKEQALKKQVEAEVAKRLEKERLLIRQSRLAAMGEMMSAITHQWNQPLSVIATVASTLQMSLALDGKVENDDLEKQLTTIENSIAFMSQTMLDFKQYFKPQKHKDDFNVKAQIDSIIQMLSPVFMAKDIKAELDLDDQLSVYGIASEFKQVILNIVANAKDAIIARAEDHAFEGKIVITSSQHDGNMQLRIHDNGGGIPEGAVAQVFDDYFTTKEEKGTGIGLSMSKMIIEEQFDGSIAVANEGDGATFTITLPLPH